MTRSIQPIPTFLLAALISGGTSSAELLFHEPFAYPVGPLSGADGGSGWPDPWFDAGNPATSIEPGLSYLDSLGNSLSVSGGAASTLDEDGTTTISARETGPQEGERWISMLIEPQNDFTPFFGLSFYQSDLELANARFAIEHAGNKNLRLTRRAGGVVQTTGFSTTVGEPVLAVLHLVPFGGSSEELPERIDVYFNPRLDLEPLIPHASVNIDSLEFDRIRLAAQNGRAVRVDEIRIGTSYASVTPHSPAEDPDSDGDGLTDAQEAILGTDPEVPNTELFAAIRANPEWFGLHSANEIAEVRIGPATIESQGPDALEISFPIKDGNEARIETVSRTLSILPGSGFIRASLDVP